MIVVENDVLEYLLAILFDLKVHYNLTSVMAMYTPQLISQVGSNKIAFISSKRIFKNYYVTINENPVHT
ncbi:MAG: hypothetical protein DRP08_06385 [Candidatus Aenigmatarchaeota archaeon]|nr:MAG: hypothetical protein DRP08_06385 [Candidatus Aenigmarchaeota archaeon]